MEFSPEIIIFLLAVAGAAGFIDAIAGGGGLLTVPALLSAGLPPVMALGTNKIQSSFGTSIATYSFARAGQIQLRPMLFPVLGALFGSMLGAQVMQHVEPGFLAALVPALLILIALYFLLARSMSDVDRQQRITTMAYGGVAAGLGFYDGFFGPGAGSFYVASMITLLGFGVLRATAHTKLLNLSSNIGAIIILGSAGQIHWKIGLAMAGASMIGARLGSMTAMRFGGRLIRPLLVVISVAMTVRLLLDPNNPIAQLIWAGPPQ